VWSAQTLASYLKSVGEEVGWVDARDVLIVPDASAGSLGEKGQALETIQPIWEATYDKLQGWWQQTFGAPKGNDSPAPFVIVTGFVCSTESGRPTTLKRSGSDYSATIFAKLLGSARVVFWKNVNGVYTADPRRVPKAFSIASMTFDEAMELAYFGGQVLHPSAMIPCIEKRIPVLVRNVFNPSHPGTRVYGRGDDWLRWEDQDELESDDSPPVKAITSIEKVALVTLSGASFLGTHGVARRMMDALASTGVNVILTSQGSSEHSITVAVDEGDAPVAAASVEQAFAVELSTDSEIRVTTVPGCSILAAIGEGMKNRPNISGRFFNALGRAQVNVIAIAQGSSERNISAVVPREDLSRALRAAHAGFTLSDTTVAVGIIGCPGNNRVIAHLLKQIANFEDSSGRGRNLRAMKDVNHLHIEVRALANSGKMLFAEHGVPPEQLESATNDLDALHADLSKEAPEGEFDLASAEWSALGEYMGTKRIPHKVLIDCTDSDDVAKSYPEWLKRGIHVVSQNKRVGAGSLDLYRDVMEVTRKSEANLYLESMVGAQMPIISVMHDIVQTGDNITRVDGIFSGTMGYILDRVQRAEGTTFSEALAEAKERGLPEPDPFADVSGLDTARKALVLARELGFDLELEDVTVESLVPKDAEGKGWDALQEALKASTDAELAARVSEAQAKGECLRYVGRVDAVAGKISVGLRSFPMDHPFSTTRDSETTIAFRTGQYTEATPLLLRGPGAGPVAIASGVFADLLRLTKNL